MVTVRLPVAPCCKGSGLGSSDTIAAGCGETCTDAVLDVLFAVAVMTALPAATPVTVKTALVCPCATITLGGACSTPAGSTDSATSVFVSCAALMLTVNWLVAPTVMVKAAGCRSVSASGGGTTLKTADALLAFRLAVMPAWP